MDQGKIGSFIAERRKKAGLTQMQLADQLNITDRAVSKWETGKAMPDTSIMLELCGILGITVNDLLCGEVVTMENYNKEMEKNLLELVKQKEQADKRLLTVEILVGTATVILYLVLCAIASYAQIGDSLRLWILVPSTVFVLTVSFVLLRIEQVAGYYECAKCGHRYIPSYSSVLWAMHMGRTRYMRCPRCQRRSWQKKRVSKE